VNTALRIVVLAILISGVGCSTGSHVATGEQQPEETAKPVEVRLYHTPPKQYQELGLVSAESVGWWSAQGETEKGIARLKKEAAKLGANGVILTNRGTKNNGSAGQINPQTGTYVTANATSSTFEGIAIRVIEE
jgi:hypothetical protein